MRKLYLLALLYIICYACNPARETETVDLSGTEGPEKGSLVIVGGAMHDTSIIDQFIALAGGPDQPLVVIPTASGDKEFDHESIKRFLVERGAEDVTVLHTYDPGEANRDDFVAPLKKAKGIWFTGGRQWRLVDSYGGTRAEEEIRAVLDRGGVIGGSSAGATIQGSYLARGDTKTNTIMMGDHERGFNYLRKSAIDQHLLVRNRQHDLIEIIRKYPDLLGIGLDENTAIVVRGNEMEVIGNSFVAIYDYGLWKENPDHSTTLANGGMFFLLRPGDKYNLKSREVTSWSGGGSRNIFAEPSN